ncbi:MAG: hypothetical protein IJO56_02425, partial [Oscillospiraceae bacterium]|nr:hypothetical protein [Oscillospiraceae bacterium]
RWECRQRRKQRPERVAAVGTKQALSVASAGNRNRIKTLPYRAVATTNRTINQNLKWCWTKTKLPGKTASFDKWFIF